MYFLTATDQIACYGTSFKTVADARNYAYMLQGFGICREFQIGCYRDGKFVVVYRTGGK